MPESATADLDALKAKLDALSHGALAKAERVALKAVGELVLGAIVERAPERTEAHGGDLAPGELKAGYAAKVHIASDAGITSGDTSRVAIEPNADVEHVARFVEYGHANKLGAGGHGAKLAANPTTPAHPFVRPALDAVEQQAIDLYQTTMTEEIRNYLDA